MAYRFDAFPCVECGSNVATFIHSKAPPPKKKIKERYFLVGANRQTPGIELKKNFF